MTLAVFTNPEMLQISYQCSAEMWVYIPQCKGMCMSVYVLILMKMIAQQYI